MKRRSHGHLKFFKFFQEIKAFWAKNMKKSRPIKLISKNNGKGHSKKFIFLNLPKFASDYAAGVTLN